MSHKTISINPNLFNINGKKTKKVRDKTQNPIIPLISPNVLKNKLLKRIKEHKQRETHNLENNNKTVNDNSSLTGENNLISNTNSALDNDLEAFSDEFSNSINYLQTLSKQKKVNDEKAIYDKQKILRREELERRTIKNYQSLNEPQPFVNIELPEELKNTDVLINNTHTQNMILKPKDSVPYGVLKGGIKPTYRDWNKTQRNNIVTNPNSALIIHGDNLEKNKLERENRLNNLREKLKQKQLENHTNDILNSTNLIQKPILDTNTIVINTENFNNSDTETANTNSNTNFNNNNNISNNTNNISNNTNNISNNTNNISNNTNNISINNTETSNTNEQIVAIRQIIKKTIKRKYTLGKSRIKNQIAVLIKDRNTRKKILVAQKDLKKKPIDTIKSYLRDHNLIKVGSGAPNDVLRKLYESAMLAGEITNSNTETLLHNFSKDDKEI